MHIQLSLSLHFCLLHLLLNNCNGNDSKHNAFFSVDCWWLRKEPVPLKRTSFILADVQSNVLSPSCMHITAFFIDQQLKVSKSGGTRKVEYTYNFLKVC